jgi:hypothetical protein
MIKRALQLAVLVALTAAPAAARSGQAWAINCQPDCAAGHFHSYPVKVTLSKPKQCAHQSHEAFSHLAVAYTGHRPAGAPTRLTLRCPA